MSNSDQSAFLAECTRTVAAFIADAETGASKSGSAVQGIAAALLRMAEAPTYFTVGQDAKMRRVVVNMDTLRHIFDDVQSCKDARSCIKAFIVKASSDKTKTTATQAAIRAMSFAHKLARLNYTSAEFDAKHGFCIRSLSHVFQLPHGAKDLERIATAAEKRKPMYLNRASIEVSYVKADGNAVSPRPKFLLSVDRFTADGVAKKRGTKETATPPPANVVDACMLLARSIKDNKLPTVIRPGVKTDNDDNGAHLIDMLTEIAGTPEGRSAMAKVLNAASVKAVVKEAPSASKAAA